ncbi:50S ribosomal protein L35 [Candidatus Aerophobetes bacterium]|uniref:Large ribosomal subunit protein bL35 n=1 Tax=Aerophobetes bacterium TaxID=2030807 RepID=A0A2A4YDJ5_UNCAE|nr:MAG: 50S ribosomal protein L35 [Candidatus Aerophobetes bacterium]
MPKMKTHKAIKARFKVTGTGKLLRFKQGRRHLLTKKSSNKKRSLRKPTTVPETHLKLYKRLMGAK